METRTVDPDADGGSSGRERSGRRLLAGGWRRSGARADERARTSLVEELEAELALLQEENARLKIRAERAPDRPDRVQDPVPQRHERDAVGDDVWELLTECHVLRTALADVCRDVEASMREIRERLDALATRSAADAAIAELRERAGP